MSCSERQEDKDYNKENIIIVASFNILGNWSLREEDLWAYEKVNNERE